MIMRKTSFYMGEDQLHCTTYSAAAVDKIEDKASYLIRRAYETWKNLSCSAAPRECGFEPLELIRGDEPGRISRVDTTVPPHSYSIQRIGPGEPVAFDLDLGNPFHRHGLFMEILECKETQKPIFQEIRVSIDGRERHKLRLLLPFGQDDGTIGAIYAMCCLVSATTRRTIDFADILLR